MGHIAHLPENPKPESKVLNGLPPGDSSQATASLGLGGLAHKIHRNRQDYGWRVTIHKALAYLIRSIYFRQIYRIYKVNLEGMKPRVDFDEHPFTFKVLSAQNENMIAEIENMAEWLRGRLSTAIANGQMCLVALDGDRVAGFNLINFDHATLVLVNLKKNLRTGCAWSEHIAVKKEFRKTGLGSQIRFRIFQELKKRGIRRLYGGTLQSNIASLNLARSVGFEEIADIDYRKFFFLENWRYKRVPR
jgi:GNAT superfamily N-acetyltransferase